MNGDARHTEDISQLWGAQDKGALAPAPLRRPEPGSANESGDAEGVGLAALEREVRRLADGMEPERLSAGDQRLIEALRKQMQHDVTERLAQIPALTAAVADARKQLRELAAQLAEASAAVEDLRSSTAATVANAQAQVVERPAARLRNDVEAALARTEVEMTSRLDHLAAQVAAVAAAIDQRAGKAGTAGSGPESQQGTDSGAPNREAVTAPRMDDSAEPPLAGDAE